MTDISDSRRGFLKCMTWAGTAIIVASGVYTVHRERVRARERAIATPVVEG